jgi:vanillate O-demethylase ferredoxin subunit
MMNELLVRVVKKSAEAEGICSFELAPEPGQQLPAFSAGAHIDVHVGAGLVRQYSLCNDPADPQRWRIAVLREPSSRGGSAGMHERLHVGDAIRVSPPRHLFSLAPEGHSLLLAGGIGVTPILSMARALHRTGRSFEMHYCARTTARMAFRAEIEAASFARQVSFHVDDGPEAQKLDADATLRRAAPGTHLYVCGPGGFMDHVLGTARRLGWPDARLHREYFAAGPVDTTADGVFEVQLARRNKRCLVPADKTVLEVLLAEGIDVPSSCEAGVCGTCLTRVLGGTPDHRDTFLTDDERRANDQFTPCCSRSKTPVLVLDL